MPRAVLLHGSLDEPSSWAGVRRALPDWAIDAPALASLGAHRAGSGDGLGGGARADGGADGEADGAEAASGCRGPDGEAADASPGPSLADALLDDLPRLLERLRAMDRPPILGGHSYGGLLALRAALAAPEAVAGLLLVEPIAFGLVPGPERAALDAFNARLPGMPTDDVVRALIDYWAGPRVWAQLPESTRRGLLAHGPRAVREVESGRCEATAAADLARLRMPTRIVWGARTTAESRAVCRALVEGVPGARGIEVPGADHAVPRRAPLAVAAALRALAGEGGE